MVERFLQKKKNLFSSQERMKKLLVDTAAASGGEELNGLSPKQACIGGVQWKLLPLPFERIPSEPRKWRIKQENKGFWFCERLGANGKEPRVFAVK